MKKVHCLPLFVLAALAVPAVMLAADGPAMNPPLNATEIKWGPAPGILPAGAKAAVLAGDPASAGFISLRLKLPAGYIIPAHWHPTDEHVTVISGTFALGMGDKFDKNKTKTLRPGGFATAPANMNHFAWTKTGAVVEVSLVGPFAMTYVNAADDPTKK